MVIGCLTLDMETQKSFSSKKPPVYQLFISSQLYKKLLLKILQAFFMLPQSPISNNHLDNLLCSCSIFNPKAPSQQNTQIFIKKNRNNCFFFNSTTEPYSKIQPPNYSKQSLRRNKDKKHKQNMPNAFYAEQSGTLENTIAKTDLMTREDSQVVKTLNEFHHLNHYSCFSSYVFKESVFQQSKNFFGRNISELPDLEEIKQNQNNHNAPNKIISEVKQETHSPSRNRPKVKCLTKFQEKEKVKVDFQRHTRSESGQVMSMPNFYSEQHMKCSSLNSADLERQVSSIVFKKKTAKKIHHLDELDFKDTQTINDEVSQSASQVISDYSEFDEKGQFSQIVAPKLLKWKKFSTIPKFLKLK